MKHKEEKRRSVEHWGRARTQHQNHGMKRKKAQEKTTRSGRLRRCEKGFPRSNGGKIGHISIKNENVAENRAEKRKTVNSHRGKEFKGDRVKSQKGRLKKKWKGTQLVVRRRRMSTCRVPARLGLRRLRGEK